MRNNETMKKNICDKCKDSFIEDGIYHVSLRNMEFDLCGRDYDQLQNRINEWFRGEQIEARVAQIIKLHEEVYVGYEPTEAKRRLIYDLKSAIN